MHYNNNIPVAAVVRPLPRAFDAIAVGGERGGASFFAPRESVSHRIATAAAAAAATARNNFHFSPPCVGPYHVSPDPGFRRRRRRRRGFFFFLIVWRHTRVSIACSEIFQRFAFDYEFRVGNFFFLLFFFFVFPRFAASAPTVVIFFNFLILLVSGARRITILTTRV